MIVLKFGGTSVGNSENIRRVEKIVRSRMEVNSSVLVVVSAFSKVTDMLYGLFSDASDTEEKLFNLRQRHLDIISELALDQDTVNRIEDVIGGIRHIIARDELTDRDKAEVISCGEMMSSIILCAYLRSAGIKTGWADIRKVMILGGDPLKGEPDMDDIRERAAENFSSFSDGIIVTQGFIGASAGGRAAVLGRGGSDYSATILGNVLNASAVEIWTDVDGVRTADPRKVPTTKCLTKISYDQASEMAHFGAKVLHPLTLEPARSRNIPVYVLNTSNPDGQFTEILPREAITAEVKTVAYKENIVILTLMSRQSMDSGGFLKKIFDTLGEFRIKVDLISTGNICVSITLDPGQKNLEEAIERLEEFAQVSIDRSKSQISAIGSNAAGMNRILSFKFTPMKNCKIYMVSPGASFINVSFVVDRKRLDEDLRTTHKFFIENQ